MVYQAYIACNIYNMNKQSVQAISKHSHNKMGRALTPYSLIVIAYSLALIKGL